MLRTLFRKLSILLSIFIFRENNIDNAKHKKIQTNIQKKAKIIFKKNPRLKTHKTLSSEIIDIIFSNKLKNFLRNNFIQNIFFIHNRLFIFQELRELKKDKNWKLWNILLKENNIGNPVPYFLYSKSSGNRIRQVYILKKFIDVIKISKLKKIKSIIELGGGYGCLADIFSKLDKRIKFIIYDMYEVNLLQYYFLKMSNHDVVINKESKRISLINDYNLLKKISKNKKENLFIANWSLSEFPKKFRYKFLPIIRNSDYSIICFQEKFENINNLLFFKKIIKKLNKKFNITLHEFNYYNKSPLNKTNHYMMVINRN